MAEYAPFTGELDAPITHDGLPARQNSDGTYSTELSITVTDPRLNGGRPTNIPSLWGGKELAQEEAVNAALASKKPYQAFNSINEAVAAAKTRSAAGGFVGGFVPFTGELDKPTPKRTLNEEFMRQLGLTARIPAHIATGTAGVAADAVSGLYNTAADKLGAGGPRFNKVTPSLNRILDQFLPSPETPAEHFAQFGGSLFGGPADITNRALQTTNMVANVGRQASRQLPPVAQNSGPRIPDALAEASRNVLRNSRYGRMLGDLGDMNPLVSGGLGYMIGGPFGMAAAGLPAIIRALGKQAPVAVAKAAPVATAAAKRLPNGRFVSAASLARAKQLPNIPLSPLQQQLMLGTLPPLFSAGEE